MSLVNQSHCLIAILLPFSLYNKIKWKIQLRLEISFLSLSMDSLLILIRLEVLIQLIKILFRNFIIEFFNLELILGYKSRKCLLFLEFFIERQRVKSFLRDKVFYRNGIFTKPRDPLTIKGLYRTNHTFTTKLYPLQSYYCI